MRLMCWIIRHILIALKRDFVSFLLSLMAVSRRLTSELIFRTAHGYTTHARPPETLIKHISSPKELLLSVRPLFGPNAYLHRVRELKDVDLIVAFLSRAVIRPRRMELNLLSLAHRIPHLISQHRLLDTLIVDSLSILSDACMRGRPWNSLYLRQILKASAASLRGSLWTGLIKERVLNLGYPQFARLNWTLAQVLGVKLGSSAEGLGAQRLLKVNVDIN